jgi:hypothetical protein
MPRNCTANVRAASHKVAPRVLSAAYCEGLSIPIYTENVATPRLVGTTAIQTFTNLGSMTTHTIHGLLAY